MGGDIQVPAIRWHGGDNIGIDGRGDTVGELQDHAGSLTISFTSEGVERQQARDKQIIPPHAIAKGDKNERNDGVTYHVATDQSGGRNTGGTEMYHCSAMGADRQIEDPQGLDGHDARVHGDIRGNDAAAELGNVRNECVERIMRVGIDSEQHGPKISGEPREVSGRPGPKIPGECREVSARPGLKIPGEPREVLGRPGPKIRGEPRKVSEQPGLGTTWPKNIWRAQRGLGTTWPKNP